MRYESYCLQCNADTRELILLIKWQTICNALIKFHQTCGALNKKLCNLLFKAYTKCIITIQSMQFETSSKGIFVCAIEWLWHSNGVIDRLRDERECQLLLQSKPNTFLNPMKFNRDCDCWVSVYIPLSEISGWKWISRRVKEMQREKKKYNKTFSFFCEIPLFLHIFFHLSTSPKQRLYFMLKKSLLWNAKDQQL